MKNTSMKHKILLIDDQRVICLLLANFLSKDYDITCKQSGKEALLWLEHNLPDLIICDLQMPEMDGLEVLTQVRSRGFTKHTPFLILSATAESRERIKCYRQGAQDYIEKPFNPEELKEIINKNLHPLNYARQW